MKYALPICFILSSAPLLSVAATSDSFWYSGIDIGQGYYANNGNSNAYDSTRHRLAGGLHLGYQFNPYFSTELAYQYLGSAYANYNDGQIGAEFQQGVLSARLGYPITQNLYPYFKVGGAGWFGKTTGLNPVNTDGFSPVFGAGISYAITDNLALRAEYQFTQSLGDIATGYSDHDLVTLGVSWRFGHSNKPMPIIQEKIVEVIMPPVIKETFIVSGYEADTLFAHNSSELVSTKVLQKTLQFLQQYPQTTITITGYTDSTGSEKYNLWMSERRANAVADYLIQQGIDAARINAVGAGESHPIADNATETGRAMNRRVEMTVQSFEATALI